MRFRISLNWQAGRGFIWENLIDGDPFFRAYKLIGKAEIT